MTVAPKNPIQQDKRRIITQLRMNLQNMSDDPDEISDLVPWMTAQASTITSMLYFDDFRPAELMALLSLLGPILARSNPLGTSKSGRRSLHAV